MSTANPLRHWLDFWDDLDRRFWSCCQWLDQELTPEELAWQPVPEVASIGWNLRHLGEMLDHYLTHVFQTRKETAAEGPLVTMVRDSRDDGRFRDLAAITAYHRRVRPPYRVFLAGLREEDLDRPLGSRPGAHTLAWAVGHIAEHESYHLGKCTLLRKLLQAK